MFVEKQDAAEGLALGRRADVSFDGQVREERGDFVASALARMAIGVEANESAYPMGVRFYGAGAAMAYAQCASELIQQLGLGARR